MNRTIRLRRDSSQDWVTANPVLAPGEPGHEEDTGRFKIGNGVARWVDLEYFVPGDNPESVQLYNDLLARVNSISTNPILTDDGPDFFLLYQNAKV